MIRILIALIALGVGLSALGEPRSTIPTALISDGTKMCTDESFACENGDSAKGFVNAANQPVHDTVALMTTLRDSERRPSLVIYFEYDRSDIRSDYVDLLRALGSFLAENQDQSVRIEAHADSRGNRHYNIDLAERRAHAVMGVLMIQGAAADQLVAVSFGEERPNRVLSDDHDLNRRVEIYR